VVYKAPLLRNSAGTFTSARRLQQSMQSSSSTTSFAGAPASNSQLGSYASVQPTTLSDSHQAFQYNTPAVPFGQSKQAASTFTQVLFKSLRTITRDST